MVLRLAIGFLGKSSPQEPRSPLLAALRSVDRAAEPGADSVLEEEEALLVDLGEEDQKKKT